MTKLTHTEKLVFDKSVSILLLHGMDEDGFPLFMFYAITGKSLQSLQKVMAKGGFNPEEYGHVILRGYGLPKDEDWQFMKEKYGLEKDKILVANLPKN